MSDTNNNAYEYDAIKNNKKLSDITMKNGYGKHQQQKNAQKHPPDNNGSVESLARYGMDIPESTDDESAFMSDDASVTSEMIMKSRQILQAKKGYKNHQYTRTKSRNSSQSARSSVSSTSRRGRQSPRRAPRQQNRRKSSSGDVVGFSDVIHENKEVTSFSRTNSHPPTFKDIEERKSRLVRRRSAITFTSTYKTLSSPLRVLPPIRPSLGSIVASTTPSIASVGSVQDACCYPVLSRGYSTRQRTSWSNLITCLAHKKENGYRMTPTQIIIRKSLEKAIQKAGYNMNELALSNSPAVSPMVMRKMEPKGKVDWTEASCAGEHIWAPSNQAGDLCYVGEALCKKSGPRKKCSACHILVHDSCLEQLDKIGFQCKVTFREAATRNLRENLIVRHHWVHRRRQEGKCKHCGKAFEKRFGFRDSKILAISCSWCKEAYHNKVSCFRMQKINEPCTLGVHARIIVPPTWIVKWTPRGKSLRNRSKKKRGSSGMWRKKSSRDGRQRLFVVRPLPEHAPYLCPTIVFINPKSGGNQGVKILQTFQWLLNQRQVFNLSDGGPKEALEMFRKVPNLRILACGGDGTVGWILSTLDEMNLSRWPPVAVLPLGTGNDLSRTLGWGSGYTDEPICKVLQHVEEGRVVQVDRWKVSVKPNLDAKADDDEPPGTTDVGVDQPPLTVINNYFSLGADAKVVLEFHESREAHPSKFNSRFGNKFFYARTGVTDYLTAKHKNLGKSVSVVCDGKDITAKIQDFKPVCLVFLNIPRYSAGTIPWGNPTGSEFEPQRHDDKLIEVLAFSSNQMGLLYVGGHGERLCQCREAVITTSRAFPIQIDGEPCRLNPSIINLTFHNQANMIYKTKRGSMPILPDLPVSEQLKICINTITIEQYEKHNGDKIKLRELSKPSHTTVVPADADLETVRFSLERILHNEEEKHSSEGSADHYSFLDLSTGEKFYRIDRTQESLHLVREIASSDGEIYVLDCTPPLTPAPIPEVNTSRTLFPRSPHVDRTTLTSRRRIQSDTTGSVLTRNLQMSLTPDPRLTPSREERSQTNKFDFLPGQNSTTMAENASDVIDGKGKLPAPGSPGDVTKKTTDPEKTSNQKTLAVASCGHQNKIFGSSGVLTDEMKRSSLPADLSKLETTVPARPLSCDDVTRDDDVINSSISSKINKHCDVIKSSESYGSVFSSPGSSRHESPKHSQDPESTLCTNETQATDSSFESLVIKVSGDVTPPITTVTPDTISPVATNTTTSTTTEGVTSLTSQSPATTSFASAQSCPVSSTSSGSRSSSSLESAESRNSPPTIEVSDHDDPEPNESESSTAHEIKASDSPTNHGEKQSPSTHETTNHDGKPSPAHEDKSPDDDEVALLAHNAISRHSDKRYSMSTIPSSTKQSPEIKARSQTTSGMTLSSFVKTQSPPPTEKLSSSPSKRRASADVSPSRDRSQTLNEFVTSLDQSEIGNDNQSNNSLTKFDKQFADAAKRGDLTKVKMALESGADPLALDGDGTTALHNAARFNHPEVVQYLIGNGPPELLHQTDRDRKQTPLHKAAWFGHKKVCEILVKAGASLTAADYKGMTPLQRAQQAEDTRLETFLAQEAVKRMGDVATNKDKETKL